MKKIANIMLVIIPLALLLVSNFALTTQANGTSQRDANLDSQNANSSNSPVYIWFFGYIGNSYYPTTELGLTQQSVLNTASNLSSTFGKQNLVFVSPVDETPIPGGTINESMIPSIESYVSQLHKYSHTVIGRLDFYQFNLSSMSGTAFGDCDPWSNCPVYNQTRMYVQQLGLNGIWFDHPSQYMDSVGNVTFNQMMQNLTTLFPGVKFILNQTPSQKLGFATELAGYTWENETYASPSPVEGSLSVDEHEIQVLQGLYPGHVIVHLDAEGPPAIGSQAKEPMSIFASLNSSGEVANLTLLVNNGIHPALSNESYDTVVPVIGSWTCDNATSERNNGDPCPGTIDYDGTLYNGLSSGNFSRSTVSSFETVLLSALDYSQITISPSKGTVGSLATVNGNHFLNFSTITIKYNGKAVNSSTSGQTGNFTISFVVPASAWGEATLAATDGTNTIKTEFKVLSSIVLSPASATSGEKVAISGSGFSKNVTISVTFNGSSVTTQPASINSNSHGSFTASFHIPSGEAPGTYVVVASAGKDSAMTNVTVS